MTQRFISCSETSSKRFEDYAYVLDFLPYGYPKNKRKGPLALVVGTKYFTLLEVSLKKGYQIKPFDKLYVGKGERDIVLKIKRKIGYEDLTDGAKENLRNAIKLIVKENEKVYVEFFNSKFFDERYFPPNIVLKLLPVVTERKLLKIVSERKKQSFMNFSDIRSRTDIDPETVIVNRVLCEIKNGKDLKYILFT